MLNSIKRAKQSIGRLALFGLFPVLAACLSLDVPGPGETDLDELPVGGHHVLFIGNSLTYFNDLPGTVAGLAQSVGDTIRAASVALPNFALIDHALGMSNANSVIKSQKWEFVILQQGPTTVLVNRDTLVLATKMFDPLVRASGGRVAELMTWPTSAEPHLFPAVRASFLAAAQSVNGVFMPAGDAWRAALEVNPQLQLYSGDGYHPAPLGTYLAALVVYEKITGHDARLLPARAVVGGVQLNTPEETVRFLQQVAHDAVLRFP
jgi:hypothetical protein